MINYPKPKDVTRSGAKKKEIKPAANSLEGLAHQISQLAKNLSNPKDKDKYIDLKERHFRAFLLKINKSNGVEAKFPTATFAPYRYYIGKGNNSSVVKTAFKTRFWWSVGDYDDWLDYNFMWTQWKSNRIISTLKTHKEVLRESAE